MGLRAVVSQMQSPYPHRETFQSPDSRRQGDHRHPALRNRLKVGDIVKRLVCQDNCGWDRNCQVILFDSPGLLVIMWAFRPYVFSQEPRLPWSVPVLL
jgi:hypothetical protein